MCRSIQGAKVGALEYNRTVSKFLPAQTEFIQVLRKLDACGRMIKNKLFSPTPNFVN